MSNQSAIIVYNQLDFIKAYRSLPNNTWLIWSDKTVNEV